MKTIYLTRTFKPISVNSVKPGDIYVDPVWGDCRRLTAKRFCLAAERAGKDSVAFLGLLGAICGAAENGVYDGRAVEDWYGLVGLSPPERKPDELVKVKCPECGVIHWVLEEDGKVWDDGVCGLCATKNFIVAGM